MKTVTILATFDGYPDGKRRRFTVDETPSLDEVYADMLIGKGLAADPKILPPAKAAKLEKQS